MIERALISVYDKSGLATFAGGLVELGIELVASGGTRAVLTEQNLEVIEVSDLTATPELMEATSWPVPSPASSILPLFGSSTMGSTGTERPKSL